MKSKFMNLLISFFACCLISKGMAADCAGGAAGSGLAPNNTVLIVWAKTIDDPSSFPTSWADSIPTTLVGFYQVMSYGQHTITTKVATKNGGFFVSDAGHTVDYYKGQYQPGQGYDGPYGIFVEEMLTMVENDYGANYFDDVDAIIMMITDGGIGWYYSSGNYTGVGVLGVNYTTANGKTFGYDDGVNLEFFGGEYDTKWNVCHEYGHFIGLPDLAPNYGAYSLMQHFKVNETNEGAVPLGIKEIIDLGWLDINNPARVKIVNSNTSVTLKPVRNNTGVVVAKINIPSTSQYFLVANHQRSTNVYDGTYPADGLLIWHISGSLVDIECAAALDPITNGFNKDHLDLDGPPGTIDPNYHGEGLATDFHNPTNKKQFTPWTNPNTDRFGSSVYTGIAIDNITYDNSDIIFDVSFNFNTGILTENSWWNGSESIAGNVLLIANKTLTVLPGTTALFAINAILTINGSLQAVGTGTGASQKITFDRSGATGKWGGIRIENSTANSNLDYCTSKNATYGVRLYFTSGNVNVNHATLTNNTSGFQGWYSSPFTIQNSTMQNNSFGIYVRSSAASGDMKILSNNLSANVIRSIYLYDGADAFLGYNSITNDIEGLTCTTNSDPIVMRLNGNYGYNVITNNANAGVTAAGNSYPSLGIDEPTQSKYGYNDIYGNGGDEIVNNNSSGSIMAERNYWSSNHGVQVIPPASEFTGSVDYLPVLPDSPPPPAPPGGSRVLAKSSITFDEAFALEIRDEYQAAADLYYKLLSDDPDADNVGFGVSGLIRCYKALDRRKEISGLMDHLIEDFPQTALSASAADHSLPYLVQRGEYRQALARAHALLEDNRNRIDAEPNLLFQVATMYHAKSGRQAGVDLDNAQAHYQELIQKYPATDFAFFARLELEEMGAGELGRQAFQATKAAAIPASFELEANYPNPFNPETRIRFHVPERQMVHLVIYDFTGRHVRTLVQEEIAAGAQTFTWDGRDEQGLLAASGVYFCRLQTGAKIASKKMTLLR